ncbi:Hypothetical predicted protein [Octopus vulgaris]|uniref:Uncharacterized protein n=1 Tax=Octopus vulgaris TaxID=6645 RepID=A0AA36ASI5_OCTVU|nr:Hypothetical predicted protein [Octopus vulgaris]
MVTSKPSDLRSLIIPHAAGIVVAIAAGIVADAAEACEAVDSKGCGRGIFNDANAAFDHIYSHATENDINIRHKGNEESDEQYSPPRGLIERLPSDQSTQRPEDTRNSIEPVKDSQENDKATITEDLAFAEEHRESMAEMRQKILNTLEVKHSYKFSQQRIHVKHCSQH